MMNYISLQVRERGREKDRIKYLFCLGHTYVGCDWDQEMKEKCYDVKAAKVSTTTIYIVVSNKSHIFVVL